MNTINTKIIPPTQAKLYHDQKPMMMKKQDDFSSSPAFKGQKAKGTYRDFFLGCWDELKRSRFNQIAILTFPFIYYISIFLFPVLLPFGLPLSSACFVYATCKVIDAGKDRKRKK